MAEFHGAKLILFVGEQIVVLRRDHTPGIPWPGFLDLPGGGREGAETAEACILREVREEIGVSLCEDELVWRDSHQGGVIFAAHVEPEAEARIVFGGEGDGWRLMRPEAFACHAEAIPHFAMMVRRYGAVREAASKRLG